MSTVENVAGKGRNLGTNFWLTVLAVALLIFGANTGYAIWKAAQLGGASSAASNLQVNSQRLAIQGREAVAGDSAAYQAFRDTKAQIDGDIAGLQDNFGDTTGVAGPIQTVATTWEPIQRNAQQVIDSQDTVLGLAGSAERFTQGVPGLQAQLDELVRAMSNTGSPSSQVYMALREVVLTGDMVRFVTQIQAGGEGAAGAADTLQRRVSLFEQVRVGLREGDENLNVQPLTNASALAALTSVDELWEEIRPALEAIMGAAGSLAGAQEAASSITAGSDQLLAESESLFQAFTAFGSLSDSSILGNVWISILS